MIDLPRPIAEYLMTSVGLDRSPAYLQVTHDGRLEDWGGDVGRYDLGPLVRGMPVATQVVVLDGMVPTNGRDVCLPCVRSGAGAPADIHIFRDGSYDWVLLLDASAFDLRVRRVQQAAHDAQLTRDAPSLTSSVLRALDMAVLERTGADVLVPVSEEPSWLAGPLPAASHFLQTFMADAEALWRLASEGASARSGPWHEDGLMPPGEWWEATALTVRGRSLLIIARSFAAMAERQRLLQTGRERGLALDAHEAELAAASSEARAGRAALQRAAADNLLLARAIDSAHELIAVLDLHDRFTFVNQAFVSAYGYSPAELIGSHVSLMLSPANPPEVVDRVLKTTQRGGWVGEALARRRDGAEFPISLSTSPVTNDAGELVGLVAVARDLAAQKQAEQTLRDVGDQLRHAQKMEAVGRLAGGVAHDFNNLLTVISGYVDLALASLDPASPAYKDVQEIGRASERASTLTRQLLAFSRRQILSPKPLDLNQLVNQISSMLRRLIGEHVQLRITTPPTPAGVFADAGQLEQVIMNLAVNARDAMPSGGVLSVTVGHAVLDDDAAGRFGLPAGRYVQLDVTDTGCGMDATTLSRVFEPFFTTKPAGEGTGLGLATTYGIVRQSGGGIVVDSAPGRGTRFTVCLPTTDPGQDAPAAPAEEAVGDGGSEVILVVEDDPAVRDLVSTVLRRRGFVVLEAASGDEALELSAAHPAPIHLLLTDTVMPGIGGRELGERLSAERPGLRVLLMSGYTDDATLQFRMQREDVAFLLKPFTGDTLIRMVREVLDRRP